MGSSRWKAYAGEETELGYENDNCSLGCLHVIINVTNYI